MDENASAEEDCIIDVAEENGNFKKYFLESESVMGFLRRPSVIYARSVTTEKMEQEVFLRYTTDIDGVVVELKSWSGIKMPVRHITLLPKDRCRAIMPLLKKHVDLTSYTNNQMSTFRHCVGFQLFYEQGWEGWVGIIPSLRCRLSFEAKTVAEIGKGYFQTIRGKFQKRLITVRTKVLRTLTKNDMNDVRNFSVLPNDQACILKTLQEAIDDCSIPEDFEIIQFCFRFGEKSREGIKLDAFELTEIKRATVHSAIDICSEEFDLMWSMTGLQQIVGTKGMLSTCLSFRDCGNFQSNLDGKPLDISKDLRSICNPVGQIRFIQLYVDVPHRRPTSRYHPVSGCIAGGMAFHKETYAAFKRDANHYISMLDSNFALMESSSCRLEVVYETYPVNTVIVAADLINVDNVFRLLERRPLIVPFESETIKCVQTIGLYLTAELRSLLEKFSGTGNIEATWKSFQLELAAEKMLWGRPFARCSNRFSVNLGPGCLEPSRSLSDEKGFLALERWTTCMNTEDSIPPCRVWTGSVAVESKIIRSVGFHDVINGPHFVIGRRLIHTLVRDIYETAKVFSTFEEFKQRLFCETQTTYRVHGGVTITRLSQILSTERRLGTNMMFGRQCEIIRRLKLELSSVLLEGLQDLHLRYFPALKLNDNHRHSILSWDVRCGLWQICKNGIQSDELRQSPSVLTTLIIAEVEIRHICYASRLKSCPVQFPWIQQCAKKLASEKMSDDQLVSVLSFVSCIAFLMNGFYVDYDRLYNLLESLPINQYKLRGLEIQSAFLMSNFNKFKLYRLHHSIPTRMPTEKKNEGASSSKERPREELQQTPEEVVEVDTHERRISTNDDDDKPQVISARAALCTASNR